MQLLISEEYFTVLKEEDDYEENDAVIADENENGRIGIQFDSTDSEYSDYVNGNMKKIGSNLHIFELIHI